MSGRAEWARLRAMTPLRTAVTRPLLLALLLAAGGAQGQYKVVGPDGKITYTDRPPTQAGSQVQPLRPGGGPAGPVTPPAGPALPAELRPLVARFPVLLYTSADCAPCDAGRKLLADRGVPFNERTVGSDDDLAALHRLTAGRTVPALSVGAQALRGFQETDWQATLDLAGYPKESRLPRGYQPPPATPVVARTPVDVAGPAARPVVEPPAAVAVPAASGIRF